MIKKVVVTEYGGNGKLLVKTTMTARKGIDVDDFKAAKSAIVRLIQPRVLGKKRFAVEWSRDGYPEGYMVWE